MLENFLHRFKTYEGGKAYRLSLEEQVVRLFTIGQLNGNFYADTDQVVREADGILREALARMPRFASQAAVYAAEQYGMKAFPTLWAVYLSTLQDKDLFARVFPRVITNPKLAHDFLTLARKGGIRKGLGQGVKRVVNAWLAANLNPVWATRYAGKLEDLARVTRPADTPATRDLLQYILRPAIMAEGRFRGYGPRRLTFPRAQALAQVLAGLETGTVTAATLAAIREHRLQLEELKHAFGGLGAAARQAVLAELIPGLFYGALVANLVTIERAFATATRNRVFRRGGQRYRQQVVLRQEVPGELVRTVAERLADRQAYRRSRMLPFGLITAAEMTTVPEWRGALSELLASLGAEAGLGQLPGVRALIGADCSGSMDARVTPSLSARAVASTYAAMAGMSLQGARVYAVSDTAEPVAVDRGGRLLDNARRIASRVTPAGTYLGKLLEVYGGEDVVLLITDSQTADDPEAQWSRLRRRPRGARMIIWDVVNYQNKISGRADVFYVAGFSDRTLELVKALIIGTGSMAETIKDVPL